MRKGFIVSLFLTMSLFLGGCGAKMDPANITDINQIPFGITMEEFKDGKEWNTETVHFDNFDAIILELNEGSFFGDTSRIRYGFKDKRLFMVRTDPFIENKAFDNYYDIMKQQIEDNIKGHVTITKEKKEEDEWFIGWETDKSIFVSMSNFRSDVYNFPIMIRIIDQTQLSSEDETNAS